MTALLQLFAALAARVDRARTRERPTASPPDHREWIHGPTGAVTVDATTLLACWEGSFGRSPADRPRDVTGGRR